MGWVEREEHLAMNQEVQAPLEGNEAKWGLQTQIIKSKETMDSVSHIKPVA